MRSSTEGQDKFVKSGVQSRKASITATSPATSVKSDDERLLARIGYKQELRREFTKWSTISYVISILGVLGLVSATIGFPLAAGGPATAVWCWFIGPLMALCLASSGEGNRNSIQSPLLRL
ncbi:MAG: hypothetical protein MMC33_008783 [Icmadophila ericetorum]|nr:hypothetical protein [Icmadophila ericetorum]